MKDETRDVLCQYKEAVSLYHDFDKWNTIHSFSTRDENDHVFMFI